MSTTFAYRGLDTAGKKVQGEVVAENAAAAVAVLKARAIFPTQVAPAAGAAAAEPGSGSLFSKRDLTADLTIFTRQLANLVAGGVQMMPAFAALTVHTENPRLAAVLRRMQDDVHGGKALWEAMALHPSVFPPLYVNMVKAGDASGQLSSVLNWLADYLEKEQARKMQIRGAMAYPTLLVIVGIAAITLLMIVVVPKFTAMFQDFGQALPLPTLALMATSAFLAHWGWTVAVGLIVLGFLFRAYARSSFGRIAVDALRLRLPLFGKLQMKAAMSRFALTTTTLLQGGVPLLEALGVVRDVMDNEVLARATDRAREGMREGERFSARLEATGVFPAFLTHMIGIGEETGDLRSMLTTVANTYDIEVETTLKALVTILEPLIIITVGIIMAGIIIAMLLPIYSLDMMGS
jgi:type II secretory pathway component PulF